MLGNTLKEARERENLSTVDVESETSIRRAYIEALEAEDWETLPSPVYVRGFIRNLSRFLNVDGDSLINEYNSILRGEIKVGYKEEDSPAPENSVASQPHGDAPKKEVVDIALKSAQKSSNKSGTLVALLFVALVALGAFYFINKDGQKEEPAEVAQTTQDTKEDTKENTKENVVKDKTVTEQPKNSPKKVTETVALPPANNGAANDQPTPSNQTQQTKPAPAGVELQGRFDGDCWVKVVVDGKVVLEDTVADGSVVTWKGNEKISVLAGNAGAMLVTCNGKDMGAMGARGQVAEKVFTK